jgi:predicted double-glycine peptidase
MPGGATPRALGPWRASCSFVLVFCVVATAGAETPPSPRIQSLKEIREKAVVMQRWETSCAAAALATVLTYGFDDPVTERHAAARMLEKTEPAKVKARGGFSLLDMKRFVEERGYIGEAYQHLSLDDLRLFHAPIVPINVHGFNHYVVLNAVNDREVLLADPAFGNRSMSLTRFKEVWLDGLAFVVTPKPGNIS